VILMTVPANSAVAPVHDRMPLVIGPDSITDWLYGGTDAGAVQAMIVPTPGEAWRSWPIGRAISDVKWDGPEIQDPIN